jgi:hypothetical protein
MPVRTLPAQEDVTAGNRRVHDADVEAAGGLVKVGTSDVSPSLQAFYLLRTRRATRSGYGRKAG